MTNCLRRCSGVEGRRIDEASAAVQGRVRGKDGNFGIEHKKPVINDTIKVWMWKDTNIKKL